MVKRTIYFVVYLLLTLPVSVGAKDEVAIYSAERLESGLVNHKACEQLEGNVVVTFHPSGMVLTADKVYRYDDQEIIEAHGHVKIVDKQGGVVQADLLTYDLQKKLAVLENNVICTSKKATFYTPQLIYHTAQQKGKFLKGGKLVQDQMVLTSGAGCYDGAQHKVTFSKEVVLVDPSYTLQGHQLRYHTETEIAYFQGSTKIIHQEGVLTTEKGGRYLLPKKHLIFNQGTLTTKDITLTADRLEVLDTIDCTATGHVLLQSKAHDAVIIGEKANYFEKEKKGIITGHPLLIKVVHNETMYLRADTFIALEKAIKGGDPEQEIHALHHVRLYQENLQGIADGAVYNSSENTIHLHNKPVVWCSNYQITGEEVSLVIEEEEWFKMIVNKDLFMASADPVGNYNQVKGHKMVANFKDGAIEKMSIMGNSESLYFALGDRDELMGMNHIKCNSMEMTMKDNELEQMVFKPKPLGLFYPAEKIEEEQMKLADFVWHGEEWPTKENILEGAMHQTVGQSAQTQAMDP